MLVQLIFFPATVIPWNLAFQAVEFDTSSVNTWEWSNGIFVLDVVVRQCLAIFELNLFKNEFLLVLQGTEVFVHLCLYALNSVTKLAINFVNVASIVLYV